MRGKYQQNRRRRGCGFAVFVLLLALLAAVELSWGNSSLRVDRVEAEISGLPAAFEGFRIVQLSDLHGKEFGEGNAALIERISEAKPDMIALTGDLLETEEAFSRLGELARKLTAIAPVYYVTGNHEWASKAVHVRDIEEVLEGAGVIVLRNEYRVLERHGEKLIIAGVDDPFGPADRVMPDELFAGINAEYPGVPTVLLAHRNNAEYYEGTGARLILTGHGHGGVVRLPFIGGLIGPNRKLFPPCTAGLYPTNEGGQMFVSRGLGNTDWEKRIFNRPELPVITLKSAG